MTDFWRHGTCTDIFAAFDTNQDGYITQAQLLAIMTLVDKVGQLVTYMSVDSK